MTKELHRMLLPREVIVGDGTLGLISELCYSLDFSKSALVVTGPKTYHIAGKKVVNLLRDAELEVNYIVVSSSIIDNVKLVEEMIKKFKPQIVLGVGGGTKIDVAKLSSALLDVPFISVPTTASHDGIASPVASIKGMNKSYSTMARSPMAILADTDIIIQSSHRFTASGCGDIISKITAICDWEMARHTKNEYYGEYAASLSLMSAKLIIENAHLIKSGTEGLRILLEALMSCGVAMSIAGSSRPCSGSEHLFSHALDLIAPKPAMHGEQCGVGAIMMAYLQKNDWKRIKDTLQEVGAPTTAEDLGIEPEYIIRSLIYARTIRPEQYTILSDIKLNCDTAEKVAKVTGVIS